MLIAVLIIGLGLVDFQKVSAESIEDLERKEEKIKEKKNDLKNQEENTEEKIEENLNKQESVSNDIDSINQQLSETRNKISTKESEIVTTNNEIEDLKQQVKEINQKIEELKEEIEAMKKRIEEREKMLKDRLRAIQSNGGNMKYVEVILGSQNFGDFISRTSAVNTIMDQDKNIMERHMAEKKLMEEKKVEVQQKKEEIVQKKAKVEKKKASLVNQKDELESLKSQLDDQMAEKEKLMGELEKEQSHLEQHKMSLEEEQGILRNQEAALEKAIKQAKQESAQLEQLGKNQPSGNGNGNFQWPTAGYITDTYGTRGGTHYGIDVGNSTARVGGDVPIRAVASGVVTRSYKSSSYGYTVFITHVVDGVQYESVYAHMKYPPMVGDLQSVQKGQQIGVMGSTGRSTGPHLHFEIHQPKWTYNKRFRVNPLNYLN